MLVPVYWCLGVTFASVDLSTIAFAQEHGHKPLAGFMLGCYALGSAIGGLLYGSRSWRTPVERRFLISLCCTAAGIATFWAQPGLLSLALVIFVSGLTISPTFIAGYSLVEGQAPVQRRTEGMAWLSSSISVGVATGSAIVGHIIDASGARWGYAFAAAGALAAVAHLPGSAPARLRHAAAGRCPRVTAGRCGRRAAGALSGKVRAWPVPPPAGGTGRAIRVPRRARSRRPARRTR